MTQKLTPLPKPSAEEIERQIAIAREIMRRYRSVLRELAKH